MRQICRTILLGIFCVGAMSASAQAKKYDLPYIGEMQEYRTDYEDTFVHIARDFNIGFVELRAANPFVDPWLPGSGTKLTIPTRHILPDAPHEGVVINLADMRLYAYFEKGGEPYSTPVGVGREGLNTPMGTTTIVRKVEGPIWRPTPRMRKEDPKLPEVVYPGDENPMGTHAMYLGWPQYAIHGTNKPFGIGRRSSSGCLRLYPEAIIKVYEQFPVGTKVTVVNQPIKTAWIGDELFLEASPTVEQSVQMEEMGEVPEQKLSNEEMKMIIKAAGAYKDRLRWPTIRKAIKERNSYPVAIARRPSMSVKGDQVVQEDISDDTPDEAKDLIEGYVAPKKAPKKDGAAVPSGHGPIKIEKPRAASSRQQDDHDDAVEEAAADEKKSEKKPESSKEDEKSLSQNVSYEGKAPSLTRTLNP